MCPDVKHPDTDLVAGHMREFGCHTLGRAIHEAVFSEMHSPYAHAYSITMAAHATEIIIKARIVQKDLMLIFEDIPKTKEKYGLLGIEGLLEHGRTIRWDALPAILLETTGYKLKEKERFNEFGKLRNKITHFAIPELELSDITLRFAFEFVDVLLEDFWNKTVVPYAQEYDEAITESYLQERLLNLSIKVTDTSSKYIKETERY